MLIRHSFALLLLAVPLVLSAQSTAPTQVKDASLLKPPSGARVALVEFADYQCPFCGAVNPILRAAVDKYHIPWVRHDFVLSYHPWSKFAAVYALWFDQKSAAVANEYRDQVFQNQSSIDTPIALRAFTRKFVESHGIALPSNVDPQGKLAAAAMADTDQGRQLGIDHTPTVFIVTAGGKGAPWREVLDVHQDLFRDIDQALADTPAPAPAHKSAKKHNVK
jgi:protein-disulfide isomerase